MQELFKHTRFTMRKGLLSKAECHWYAQAQTIMGNKGNVSDRIHKWLNNIYT